MVLVITYKGTLMCQTTYQPCFVFIDFSKICLTVGRNGAHYFVSPAKNIALVV